MEHMVKEYDVTKMVDCFEKASKISLAVIHEVYDNIAETNYVSDEDMHKVKSAIKTLYYIKSINSR